MGRVFAWRAYVFYIFIGGFTYGLKEMRYINITTELFSSCMLICKHALYFWRRKKQ